MAKNIAEQALPIGVLDSGVGGLSVLKCLREQLPQEDFLYLGDTARAPYGTRSEAEIRGFVEEMLCWLEGRGVKLCVIACNTLTMLGIDSLQKSHPFPLVGMDKGVKLLLNVSKKRRIGVFATPFTISTGAHVRAILAAAPEAQVFPVACSEFAALIESEKFGSVELTAAIEHYTACLKAADVDALLLACTHYPYVKEEIAAALGTGVVLIDPAAATAQATEQVLAVNALAKQCGAGKLTLAATADLDKLGRLAQRMLETQDCVLEKARL